MPSWEIRAWYFSRLRFQWSGDKFVKIDEQDPAFNKANYRMFAGCLKHVIP